MHNLKPNTKYKVLTVRIACCASLSDAEITDGANEMLRAAASSDDGFAVDYAFAAKLSTYHTDTSPEEGDPFNQFRNKSGEIRL